LRSEMLLERLTNRIRVPVRRKTVMAGGIKTAYLDAGKGQPVILVHGGDAGIGGIRWIPVIGPLSKHFNVIAPDMPGYGESDKPFASYDRYYFSQWLDDFINTLGFSSVRIVAHSLGGSAALQYTIEKANIVKQLVLVNSAGLGKSSTKVPLHIILRMIWNNLFPSPKGSEWFLKNLVLYDPEMLSQELLELEEYGRVVLLKPGGKRVFWLGRGRKVLSPTLIIWGAEDPNFPLDGAQEAAKEIPNARLHIISKARHLCYYDQPREFNEVLIDYLMKKYMDDAR